MITPLRLLVLFAVLIGPALARPTVAARVPLEHRIDHLNDPDSSVVLVAAHRGDWRRAPENSLLAIKQAADIGVDIVEIDIRRTRDGVLVLMHDETVDRTTDGSGRVDQLTAADVSRLHLRNGLGRVTRFTVPTLAEALVVARDRVMLNIDKGGEHLEAVLALTESSGTTGQVIVKSAMPVAEALARYGERLEHMVYMPVVDLEKGDPLQIIADYQRVLNPVAFELIFSEENPALLATVRQRLRGRSRIWINALWPSLNAGHDDDRALDDPDGSYGWLLASGATIIQSDRCRLLMAYLETQGLREPGGMK